MSRIPPIELLEATHRFPGKYVFKAIGTAQGDFVARLLESVREVLGLAEAPPHGLRETAGGRHVAVTLELTVPSARDVVAIYERLVALPGVVLVL